MAAPERARPPPQGLDVHWAANRGVVRRRRQGRPQSRRDHRARLKNLRRKPQRVRRPDGAGKDRKGSLVSAPWPSKKAVIGTNA